MYSREEKLKAVELFIKYDKSPASAIRELGYPCRAPSTSAHRRYTEDQKRAAVWTCYTFLDSQLRDIRG